MLPKRITPLSACACALLAAAGAAFYTMRAGGYRARVSPAGDAGAAFVNRPLPECRLTGPGQRPVDADEMLKGRVLFVYLTTDCRHCIREAEVISRLRRDAPPEVKIYGVAMERAPVVEAFAEEYNLTFPVLLDEGARLARSLDLQNFPSKFLVQDGVIKQYWRGATRDEAELRRQLEIK